ncbi:MAG: hypothetical protein WA734_00655, partial [Candidatus Acidiferrales bacterium]
MAGLSAPPAPAPSSEFRGLSNLRMFAIIAQLRWNLLRNSLRTIRGRLEAVSRAFATITMTMLSIGGAIGLSIASYLTVADQRFSYL